MLLPLIPPPPSPPRDESPPCEPVVLPTLNLHSMPSPRPLPKRQPLPAATVVPMTTLHKRHAIPDVVLDVDDCHNMAAIADAFASSLHAIKTSLARIDATMHIFQDEMADADDMVQLIQLRCAHAKDMFARLVHGSAVTIQRCLRGFFGRLVFRRCIADRAARIIQRVVRHRRVRRLAHYVVFKSTMANTILGLRTFNKFMRAHPGTDPSLVYDQIRASIKIQQRWRSAFLLVRARHAEMAAAQHKERLRQRLQRFLYTFSLVYNIVRFWRRATIFHYFTVPAYKITRNNILSGLQRWRHVAMFRSTRRQAVSFQGSDAFSKAARAIHAGSSFGKEPKAWYARHSVRMMDDRGRRTSTFASVVEAAIAAPPKLQLQSTHRTLSLPGTIGLGEWSGQDDSHDVPIVVTTTRLSVTTVPAEFHLSTPRTKPPKDPVPRSVARQKQVQFAQTLQDTNKRRRLAVAAAKAKKEAAADIELRARQAKTDADKVQRLERMKQLENDLEQRRLTRLREQQRKRDDEARLKADQTSKIQTAKLRSTDHLSSATRGIQRRRTNPTSGSSAPESAATESETGNQRDD
ncbi:hypothetical protein SDRG_08998 [Saprolegnia diclina VS20]|uniref:Uncharacterized protein n=1 Tax=Saprolegnia diclina (strain VS20) TaxID=1156394 RepID=T0Q6P0_SAPDV|nr:hypothetical protein SDRG_08998 [Saprolegnia diclina VS20]EQC33489.1 hypothetical protein SDRG_08998 [Saprolegnia diclina VS20]|eukprot:XP_008613129.1 hypothetical protein SDRG_08998 [Saprolegnia diclina VS20]